jgi:putative transposase
VAADFFTIEAWTRRGLQRFVILFFMELSTRKVEIAGIASSPSGMRMNQVGRNLTDAVDGVLNGKGYLIHDRDPLFTAEFLSMLGEADVASVKLPPRSPFEKLIWINLGNVPVKILKHVTFLFRFADEHLL